MGLLQAEGPQTGRRPNRPNGLWKQAQTVVDMGVVKSKSRGMQAEKSPKQAEGVQNKQAEEKFFSNGPAQKKFDALRVC